jgi:basic amino acid/polyamine antiporter, APA family
MDEQKITLKRNLGLFSTVAIIVGQMIGSGIYMAPQGLAQLENPKAAVLAMLITGIGTVFLAISFASLGKNGTSTDSAIIYTQRAFGDLPAFWVGWSYWCGCWISNGAIILAGLSYASYFIPAFAGNTIERCAACIVILWIYTLIDIWGVKQAGAINLLLTILKLVPLLLFAVIAAFHFDSTNFQTVSSESVDGLSVLPVAMAYTLWSFLGFEGASVNADAVKDQKKIGKFTILSTLSVVIVYLVLIILADGAMPQSGLVSSASPFADIIYHSTGGYWAGGIIALGGALSAIGCAGPWILSGGIVAHSMSTANLLPKSFSKVGKRGTPYVALLVNGVLMTAIMLIAWLTKEGSLYNFFVMLATMSYLVFYAFGAASEIVLSGKHIKPFNIRNFVKCSIVSLIGLVYAIYTIYGSGAQYVFYGFLLMLIGLPVFIYVKLKAEAGAREQSGTAD